MMPAMGSTGGQAGMGSEQQHAASSWTRRYQVRRLAHLKAPRGTIRLACSSPSTLPQLQPQHPAPPDLSGLAQLERPGAAGPA